MADFGSDVRVICVKVFQHGPMITSAYVRDAGYRITSLLSACI